MSARAAKAGRQAECHVCMLSSRFVSSRLFRLSCPSGVKKKIGRRVKRRFASRENVISPLAMARRRSRKLRRATWFAQDIAFLLALQTLKAISWVHGKVHLGVRRLRANAR